MRPGDQPLATEVSNKLTLFSEQYNLPGIDNLQNKHTLVEQIIDSIRRIKYIRLIRDQDVSQINLDTSSDLFDPLKGAVYHKHRGNINEAFWLVFLATHFGKHKTQGWKLARAVYGGGQSSPYWTWERITADPDEFLEWLDQNQVSIKQSGGMFGNHRKYESCNAYRPNGTGATIMSYINWIGSTHDHVTKIEEIPTNIIDDPRASFHYLYSGLDQVRRFGRTAKFDYLTMLGKLDLVDIEPGLTYLDGATGPLRGARLLFGNNREADLSIQDLELRLGELENTLELYYGMQVLEDALCNWQKNPFTFEHFSG